MRLLKIGRSATNNIVLNSEKVSTIHAELILLDSGEMLLVDKGSTNGTFVNNQRITPDVEVPVKKGDLIRLADEELNWHKVPPCDDVSKYKKVINIGKSFHNDIVIDSPFVSRFHASLVVTKDNKVFIKDSSSVNGTKVNGVKIQPGKEVRVRRGDVIICGDIDVTEQIRPFLPNPFAVWQKVAIGAGAAAVLVGLVWIILKFIIPAPSLDEIRKSVVYVDAQYTSIVKFEDSPIHDDIWLTVMGEAGFSNIESGELPVAIKNYSATAFFLDREGRMATNRHVATPWEYVSENEKKSARTAMAELIEAQVPLEIPYNNAASFVVGEYDKSNTLIWRMIKRQALAMDSYNISTVNALIRQLKKCKTRFTGRMNFISVGYPGRYYTHTDEYERCFVLTESGTDDKDIALLQLNTKKTPDDVTFVFDLDKVGTEKLEPLKDKLVWIGYPRGIAWNLDNETHSLEPEIRETMCSKIPSKYSFEFQGESLGGASGSPIFDPKTGNLVGVLWGGWAAGATYGHACQAKYLKEMYDEEVGL